mmetsp:Transcript_17163/g.26569  ORF Transcript_17163/g.26569 Transcript_17163/m.26569 type:complete len:109 (+) Transcript_17163:951-1277(+)
MHHTSHTLPSPPAQTTHGEIVTWQNSSYGGLTRSEKHAEKGVCQDLLNNWQQKKLFALFGIDCHARIMRTSSRVFSLATSVTIHNLSKSTSDRHQTSMCRLGFILHLR